MCHLSVVMGAKPGLDIFQQIFHITINTSIISSKGTLLAKTSLPTTSLTANPAPPFPTVERAEPSKLTLSHPGGGGRQTTAEGELLGSEIHSKTVPVHPRMLHVTFNDVPSLNGCRQRTMSFPGFLQQSLIEEIFIS